MKRILKYSSWTAAFILVLILSVDIHKTGGGGTGINTDTFDPKVYALSFLENDLPAVLERAPEADQILKLLVTDKDQALNGFAHVLGISRSYYFLVKGEGNIKSIEQSKFVNPSVQLKSAPKIFREDCRIDWTKSTDEVYNKIRGLSPYPAAFTYFTSPSGESFLVKIYRTTKSPANSPDRPSKLVTDGRSSLAVTTADGIIDIREIQQAGKRIMKIDEFLRGFRINSDWQVG